MKCVFRRFPQTCLVSGLSRRRIALFAAVRTAAFDLLLDTIAFFGPAGV
jgi:hypothetical protein